MVKSLALAGLIVFLLVLAVFLRLAYWLPRSEWNMTFSG